MDPAPVNDGALAGAYFAYLLAPANPYADIAFTHIPTTAGVLVESSPADHLMVALPELAPHGIRCTRLGWQGWTSCNN